MEPLNCVADVRADRCEVWTGTQFQTVDRDAAAQVAGLKPEQVELHTTLLGGGFGRRAVAGQPLRARGGADLEGRQGAGQGRSGRARTTRAAATTGRVRTTPSRAGLDAAGQARRLAAAHRLPVVPRRHAVRAAHDQGRHRRHRRRRRRGPALRDPQPARGLAQAPGGVPDAVVALGRPLAHGVRRRDASSTSWRTRPARTRSSSAARCSASTRATSACSSSPPRRPAGASRCPQGRGRGIAVHESFGSFVAHVAEVSVVGRGQGPGAPRRLRDRLRPGREPRHDRGADRRRRRLRPDRRALRRDHVRERARASSGTSTTTRCCG